MPTTTIVLNGQDVDVVIFPTSPGFRSVEIGSSNSVAVVKSIFTGQTQTQEWPGADSWTGTFTLPSLSQQQADLWLSALLQCRGMKNAFLIGDPLKKVPRGSAAGVPAVDGSAAMSAGSIVLPTAGWATSRANLLLPGDYIQVGYRLHRVLDPVNSDANGKASIAICPSLREIPQSGQLLVTQQPKGLFRLANNNNSWSADFTKLTNLSFQIAEYR